MEVRFVVIAPLKARKSYRVRLPCDVGRGDEAKFRLRLDSVSRRHCSFAVEGAVVAVTDLGSTNGTFVAGRKIEPHAATPVPNGGEVRIGGVVLRVEYGVDGAATGSHVADTVPLAAAVSPEAGSAAEPHDIDATVDAAPAVDAGAHVAEAVAAADEPAPPPDAFPEPAVGDVAAAADGFPAILEADAAPAPADPGSFEFLGGESEPPPKSDDKLDDFFKSIS